MLTSLHIFYDVQFKDVDDVLDKNAGVEQVRMGNGVELSGASLECLILMDADCFLLIA